jgi:hypothetical protein
MTAAVQVSSSHCRSSVIFLSHQHDPSGARALVGGGNGNEVGRFAARE